MLPAKSAQSQTSVTNMGLKLFVIDNSVSWTIDPEKSTPTENAYEATVHTLTNAVYDELLKQGGLDNATLDASKIAKESEMKVEKLAEINIPMFIKYQNGDVELARSVEIWTFHEKNQVTVNWKDPQGANGNQRSNKQKPMPCHSEIKLQKEIEFEKKKVQEAHQKAIELLKETMEKEAQDEKTKLEEEYKKTLDDLRKAMEEKAQAQQEVVEAKHQKAIDLLKTIMEEKAQTEQLLEETHRKIIKKLKEALGEEEALVPKKLIDDHQNQEIVNSPRISREIKIGRRKRTLEKSNQDKIEESKNSKRSRWDGQANLEDGRSEPKDCKNDSFAQRNQFHMTNLVLQASTSQLQHVEDKNFLMGIKLAVCNQRIQWLERDLKISQAKVNSLENKKGQKESGFCKCSPADIPPPHLVSPEYLSGNESTCARINLVRLQSFQEFVVSSIST